MPSQSLRMELNLIIDIVGMKGSKSKLGTQSDKIELQSFLRPSQQALQDENSQQLEYLNTHINPILSRMMIRIINQNPAEVVEYMIGYLKEEESALCSQEFQNNLSKTIRHRAAPPGTTQLTTGELSSTQYRPSPP